MFRRLDLVVVRIYYWRYFLKFRGFGKNIKLSRGGTIIRPQNLHLGSDIFISERFHISAMDVVIGNYVMIGPNLVLISDNHKFDRVGVPMFTYSNDKNPGKVVIGNDVWIGANVTVLPGVTIGDGCVVGAGSVVVRDLPPNMICVGNPCRPIKARFTSEYLEKHKAEMQSWI